MNQEYVFDTLAEKVYKSFLEDSLLIVEDHTKRVVGCVGELAERFDIDVDKAKTAALLHDISGLVPNVGRIEYCRSNNIDLLEEELSFPLITHQKISRFMAKNDWKVDDEEVLSAIGCHTTLKKNPSQLDMLIFVADKLEWDQAHQAPFLQELKDGLDQSLEHAAYAYIDYMLKMGRLKVIHPWLAEAHEWLKVSLELT